MVREPWVINDGGTYKMWYEGAAIWPQFQIGYATSPDGITWTKHGSNPVLSGTASGWDGFQVYAPSVVKDGGTYHMYYSGTDNDYSQRWSTGYATSADGIAWTKAVPKPGAAPGWERRLGRLCVGHERRRHLEDVVLVRRKLCHRAGDADVRHPALARSGGGFDPQRQHHDSDRTR